MSDDCSTTGQGVTVQQSASVVTVESPGSHVITPSPKLARDTVTIEYGETTCAVAVERATVSAVTVSTRQVVTVIGGANTQITVTSPTNAVGTSGGSVVKVSSDDSSAGTLEEKIAAGTGIALATLSPGGSEQLEVSATGSATNVGGGAEIFKQKTGADLELRTLIEGANVTINQLVDTIEISSSGGGNGNVAQNYVFTADSPVPNQGTLGLFIGLADSLVAPLPLHESSVLLWVSITTDQVDATNDYIVEIFVDGVLLPAASLALPSGSKEEHSATLTEALLAQVGVAVWLRRTAGSGKSDFSNITVSLVFETPQAFAEFSTAFSSAFRKPAP